MIFIGSNGRITVSQSNSKNAASKKSTGILPPWLQGQIQNAQDRKEEMRKHFAELHRPGLLETLPVGWSATWRSGGIYQMSWDEPCCNTLCIN